jgi:hypothetical protein
MSFADILVLSLTILVLSFIIIGGAMRYFNLVNSSAQLLPFPVAYADAGDGDPSSDPGGPNDPVLPSSSGPTNTIVIDPISDVNVVTHDLSGVTISITSPSAQLYDSTGAATTLTSYCVTPVNNFFPVGMTTVTCRAYDSPTGYESQISFSVNVNYSSSSATSTGSGGTGGGGSGGGTTSGGTSQNQTTYSASYFSQSTTSSSTVSGFVTTLSSGNTDATSTIISQERKTMLSTSTKTVPLKKQFIQKTKHPVLKNNQPSSSTATTKTQEIVQPSLWIKIKNFLKRVLL